MDKPSFDGVKNLLSSIGSISKSTAVAQIQTMIIPHVIEIFADHGHEDLRAMIVTDYPLVREQTPQGVRNALANLGSNAEMRDQWEAIMLNYITPENIIEWLRNPEDWLDADDAAEQRVELRKCAKVIEETDGGMRWLEQQVLEIYRMGNIIDDVPSGETPKRVGTDD